MRDLRRRHQSQHSALAVFQIVDYHIVRARQLDTLDGGLHPGDGGVIKKRREDEKTIAREGLQKAAHLVPKVQPRHPRVSNTGTPGRNRTRNQTVMSGPL